MWLHLDRQLQFLKYATVFPGVDSPKRILNLLLQLRPHLIASLPLALTRLGELWRFSSERTWHPEVLFTAGDVLSDARRHRLQDLWHCDVRNFYGLSEIFGPLASQTMGENNFDWMCSDVHVDILDSVSKEPVSLGQTGVAVFTTLWERPAKLVRYWSGDFFTLVKWLESGRPRFKIRGREHITLPSLRTDVHPVDVDDILLSDPAIGNEWTVERQNDLININLEPNQPSSAVDPETMCQLQNCFDQPVQLNFVSPGFLDRSRVKIGLVDLGYASG
jgi:phenylacetate-coenzyme A ligase PaaK-like adenylate-forming protein